MTHHYHPETHTRQEIDAMEGATVLDFGANDCGYCQAARPLIDAALRGHTQLTHLKIEDGKGRKLGRTSRVKMSPTLIFMRNGEVLARVVRPTEAIDLEEPLARLLAQ
jgi:thioredoxin 1